MASRVVTEEVLRLIGTTVFSGRGTVDRIAFQRWAAAVGDLNPIYFDDEVARAAGYRSAVMPPLFVSVVCAAVNSVDDLNPDGSQANDPMESLPVPSSRLMAAGDDLEVLLPVYAGDQLTAECTLRSIEEHKGGQGPFAVVGFAWTYHNQDGSLVCRSNTSVILR